MLVSEVERKGLQLATELSNSANSVAPEFLLGLEHNIKLNAPSLASRRAQTIFSQQESIIEMELGWGHVGVDGMK